MPRGKYKIYGTTWRRKSRRRGFLIVGFVCLVSLFGVAFLELGASKRPHSYDIRGSSPPSVSAAPLSSSQTVNYGLPVRLKIPKLGVDAHIIYMGLTKTGDMAVPANIAEVGWYKNGPLPGTKGSAVLAGHIDGTKGKPGVFAGLNKLQKGDVFQVIDSNGSMTSFTVRETRTYGKDEQPSEVFNATDAAHLNLITCTGAWDAAQHHFLRRLVVFADKSS